MCLVHPKLKPTWSQENCHILWGQLLLVSLLVLLGFSKTLGVYEVLRCAAF